MVADRSTTTRPRLVWYASYGSNTDPQRLHHYIAGGRPPGAARGHPGCRDRTPPRASVPLELPGALYFATWSELWSGGRAFHDPDAPGTTWAHAHLVTAEQFDDIAAQEMYRTPGSGPELDLGAAIALGRVATGPGRYETLVHPGYVAGLPVLTFTAPWHLGDVPTVSPSAAYLRHLALGLRTADAWDATAVARYLAGAPGAAPWTAEEVAELLAEPG
ncbi:histone deacetylase [Streptomyces sp. NPDC047315]|uniref:histone deacetylase n=1 Tax=Streptomyces sp. NPDC047315 TaxID=3155142 RepID=UPI0033D0ED8F